MLPEIVQFPSAGPVVSVGQIRVEVVGRQYVVRHAQRSDTEDKEAARRGVRLGVGVGCDVIVRDRARERVGQLDPVLPDQSWSARCRSPSTP